MHGPGLTPPRSRPHTAVLVLWRVVFTILAVGSLGLLAWGAMLRVACVRRRPLDWLLFAAALALSIGSIAVIGIWGTPAEVAAEQAAPPSAADWVALAVMLGMTVGVPVHFLIADIRHYPLRPAAVPGPPPQGWAPAAPVQPPYSGASYGYPPQQYRAQQNPPQQYRAPQYPTEPQRLAPQPQPQRPAPQSQPQPQPSVQPQPRIHQVRAELDELSELLRKDRDTGRGGTPGGPR
ncbi:hypothetical protein [Streptomyces sp. NPDC054863]